MKETIKKVEEINQKYLIGLMPEELKQAIIDLINASYIKGKQDGAREALREINENA